VAFREKVRVADAVLFATPEYNRSVPGVLKNGIDVASRPKENNAFDGKPGAVISVSPGALSGFGANQHLRQMLVFLNLPTMQRPEAYVGGANKLFDATGKLTNDSTREFLKNFADSFEHWVELILTGKKSTAKTMTAAVGFPRARPSSISVQEGGKEKRSVDKTPRSSQARISLSGADDHTG
jgi:multimeric flavodoxin WrbA